MVHINSNLTGYGPWPLPDITLFSRLHTNLIGTSDLASLFFAPGVFLFGIYIYVTRSDKIGLIAEIYTCSVYGVYHLICGCHLNIVCFIQFLRIVCIYGKTLTKMLCIEK